MNEIRPETFYQDLRGEFRELLRLHGLEEERVAVSCRALSAEETLGQTRRQDFPIITGKEVMIEAVFRGSRGQAFTDSPCTFQGTLCEILALDLVADPHDRALFIATLNAVMSYLGKCTGTVHCRVEGPELCAVEFKRYLEQHYPPETRVALIGYQPALLEMLSASAYELRVADLSPVNVGAERYGVLVEDGDTAFEEINDSFADLILCTGSTIVNGSIVNYLGLDVDVIFYGTTISGASALLGLKRLCFADQI